MIDSEEYREGNEEKHNNRYPLGTVFKAVTIYLWYNGSTTFVDVVNLCNQTERE